MTPIIGSAARMLRTAISTLGTFVAASPTRSSNATTAPLKRLAATAALSRSFSTGVGGGGGGAPDSDGDPSGLTPRKTIDSEDGDTGDSTGLSTGQETSRKMYDAQSTRWVRTEPRCLSDFTGRPVVFSLLEPHVSGGGATSVLDVGCGEGYCARKVVEMGASRVVGVDISEGMVESARAVSDGDDRFRYYAASCSDLVKTLWDRRDDLGLRGPAEGSMDVAMAVFLFNYLTTDETGEAMRQIHSALKPGGTFVFSVPHPSMIYCHDPSSVFHLRSEGKGYFSSRDERILGQICTLDGEKLNIMSVHKTLGDYMDCIRGAGFEIIDIREAGVTEGHMKLHPEFFESVQDRPLHLVFELKK
eukprot:CAMPEP_0113572204 /NCGR_PEP_ID=MMETSP0015_2-20120614/25968_1 /TAXON_ID=2838 /ORGANISM="Odontella" /LENGTH=359 /DNA_ID=CAMNT_0000475217 /DNA_START=84 /DNA_END=1160 /DNA_ORIENTATION=- /assembly_acc=CAM_ASM_000160